MVGGYWGDGLGLSLSTFIHSFLLYNVYLARSLRETNLLNLLPLLLETFFTYMLFLLKILHWTLTDESTGTVSFILTLLLSALSTLTPSSPILLLLPLSLFLLSYSFFIILFLRKSAYLALGRGGTPATWFGFIRISVFEHFRVEKFTPMANNTNTLGFLGPLLQRAGPRLNVLGIAPSRQADELPPSGPLATHATWVSKPTTFAAAHLDRLAIRSSFLEGAIPALFAVVPTSDSFAEFGNEIGHPHEKDGSMHLALHPADTAAIINNGWGERHPLCRNGKKWWVDWHHAHGDRPPVPESLVLVYAPVDAEGEDVMMECVKAAAAYCAGVRMEDETEGSGSESSGSY